MVQTITMLSSFWERMHNLTWSVTEHASMLKFLIMYAYTCMYICMSILFVYVCVYLYLSLYVCMHMFSDMYVYKCMHVHLCMYVHQNVTARGLLQEAPNISTSAQKAG